MSLRVGFAGTPPFAAEALKAIVEAGFDVPLVLTRPDRRQGRGLKLTPSAVKSFALGRGLTVLAPANLKSDDDRISVTSTAIDVLVVAAYGVLLPVPVLSWPRYGCINIHASLLPRWRGAAPIQRALLAGDPETGVSIMQMDAGLDTGPVIDTVGVNIEPRETSGTLLAKLAAAGAVAVTRTLQTLERDQALRAAPQPDEGATYAAKIARADALIDWNASALAVDRQVRALNPSPGATTTLEGNDIKIWSAEPARGHFGPPGSVVSVDDRGIVVACGEGALVVRELQRAGGRRMDAAAFVTGNMIDLDARFTAPTR